jgi:hypothetical protein
VPAGGRQPAQVSTACRHKGQASLTSCRQAIGAADPWSCSGAPAVSAAACAT